MKKNLILVVLLFLSGVRFLLAAATKDDRQKIKELTAAGISLYQNKNYKEAMDLFMQVLIIEPQNATARQYIRKSADMILAPERERIQRERLAILEKARKALAEQKVTGSNISQIYRQALKEMNQNYYLKASRDFQLVIDYDPNYENARVHLNSIQKKMEETALQEAMSDAEQLAYAKGFVAYQKQKWREAANQWEKIISLNPRQKEVAEYLKIVQDKLQELALQAHYQELEEEFNRIFNTGQKNYESKKYVQAIQEWEKITEKLKTENPPTKQQWQEKVSQAIELALNEIKKLQAAQQPRTPTTKPKEEPKIEIDEDGSNKHYTEGLIAYAQGRLRDAIREWEMALRLNPNNEKGAKAREKAEKELKAQ